MIEALWWIVAAWCAYCALVCLMARWLARRMAQRTQAEREYRELCERFGKLLEKVRKDLDG